MNFKEEVRQYFENLQDQICNSLEELDTKGRFQEDLWQRPGGGGGKTRIIQGGLIEKGGVNFSAVYGDLPEVLKNRMETDGGQFFATGVSIVLHPVNAHMPIIHMNVRYFEMNDGRSWFGGGIDLTPHYVLKDQAQYFHQKLKEVCDAHHPTYYPAFKDWADEYFYIKHRQETRGIGGIFFDRLSEKESFPIAQRFAFVRDVGEVFVPIYTQLAEWNRDKTETEAHKNWQLIRRGRYVEFNLVYDQGTKFGLETSGRIESILMSLPLHASWQYNQVPDAGSPEAQSIELLQKGIDWIQ